ncbi:MAG: hypothetical protein GY809_04175 [Planctomycetes bacterium]|nr:hypothetical protein [Planctomycetota bacterium]
MMHRLCALIHPIALLVLLAMPQGVIAATGKPGSAQIIILKLDDVVAHSSSHDAPVSPRWQRVTDFLKDANLKGSFGFIGYSLEQVGHSICLTLCSVRVLASDLTLNT